MTVAYVGSDKQSWDGTSTTFAHNSGSAEDRLLIVCTASITWSAYPTSITYAGVALTLLASQHDNQGGTMPTSISVWYLTGPASGNNSVVIANPDNYHCAIAATYSGVFSSTPVIASSTTTSTGQNGSWSDSSVPSDAAGLCIAICAPHNDENVTVSAGQTERNEIGTGSYGGNNVQLNLSDEAGTGSPIAMSASCGGGADSIAFITFGLQPPQNVLFDASVNPATATLNSTIGAIDDSNILLGNLSVSVGVLSVSLSVNIKYPIEADMTIGVG